MSRILRRCAGAALAVALGACAQAQPPAPGEPSKAARIARVEAGLLPPVVLRGREVEPMALSDRLDHYRASALSLAVIDGYEVVWAQAWGTVALGRDEEVTPESLFQAGSVSKPVAALVVAALALKGELSLDLPLAALVEGRPEIREAVGGRLLRGAVRVRAPGRLGGCLHCARQQALRANRGGSRVGGDPGR